MFECKRCHDFFALADMVKSAEEYIRQHGVECLVCYRLRRYGLTRETYALLPGADGTCALCQDAPSTHIDHDHACCPGRRSCGKCVRWVLCGTCNRGLGYLERFQRLGLLGAALEATGPDLGPVRERVSA